MKTIQVGTIQITIAMRPVLKRYRLGNSSPVQTQCVVRQEEFVISVGTVVKHENDKHDQKIAIIKAAQKAITKDILNSHERTKLWDALNEDLDLNLRK